MLMYIFKEKKRIGNHHMNAELEIGNSGRRVGSHSLLWGGSGRGSVVSELLVAALGLDGSERKVVTVLGLDGLI